MSLHVNNTLEEKYDVIHEIKKGGFGIVYYGQDKKLNKPVAIKEIAPNLLDDPKYLDMFQEEALNIAKLSHNNIVHIYELKKVSNGNLYIIMEYIDGIDLEKVIRAAARVGKKIPTQLAVYIVAEICTALDYAHQRRDAFTNKPLNLVHQDISPSNIMISRFGGVKLIDFGIATVRRHQSKKLDNKLRGKIPYMATEQLLKANAPDQRSDLFSLSLVLFEALTGERLFNTQDEVMSAGKNPKQLKKIIKSRKVPGALLKILFKGLETDISKRYQSANHMYIDLLQYLISCNETGELMEQLADFVSGIFDTEGILTPATDSFSPNGSDNGEQSITSNSPILNTSELQRFSTSSVSSRGQSKQPVIPNPGLPTQFQTISTIELDEEDEELKTVIDVIRIQSRTNKKRIFQTFMALLAALILFVGLDAFQGWTPMGVTIYDWLFRPTIEIATVPKQATIFLDGNEVTGTTPLSIDNIMPGVHKLEMALPGYRRIVKSLFVPREGQIQIQGKNAEASSRTYLFRFATEIEITSRPVGASVFINGVRYHQPTPCLVTWEVGMPLNLELQHPGFDRLTGYALNTVESFDVVEDRRLWQLQVLLDKSTRYLVQGTFRKEIVITTVPSSVEIFDVDTNTPIGVTGRGRSILLTAGKHELELRKGNLIPKRITVDVNENTENVPQIVMTRQVFFTASDEMDNGKKEIGASLTSIKTNRREWLRTPRRTPTSLTLPAYPFVATFEGNGYQREQVPIGAEIQAVHAQMEAAKSILEIRVIDALTEQPVQDVNVFYNYTENLRPQAILLGKTDINGNGTGELVAGSYHISVLKTGYSSFIRRVVTQRGQTHNFVFEIFPIN